jgi:hypothetical protein
MSMNTKHTPAPWTEFRDGDSHDIIGPDGLHIARMEPRNGADPQAEQDADARLIASAPRLAADLALLQRRLDVLTQSNADLRDALAQIVDIEANLPLGGRIMVYESAAVRMGNIARAALLKEPA